MNAVKAAIALLSAASTIACQTAAVISPRELTSARSTTSQTTLPFLRDTRESITPLGSGVVGARRPAANAIVSSVNTSNSAALTSGKRGTLIIVAAVVAVLVLGSLLIGDSPKGSSGY